MCGLTGVAGSAKPATEWATGEVGSSNTRPSLRTETGGAVSAQRRPARVRAPWPGWDVGSDLRFVQPGYVINRWTGEVLSSVIADVRRERGR